MCYVVLFLSLTNEELAASSEENRSILLVLRLEHVGQDTRLGEDVEAEVVLL